MQCDKQQAVHNIYLVHAVKFNFSRLIYVHMLISCFMANSDLAQLCSSKGMQCMIRDRAVIMRLSFL